MNTDSVENKQIFNTVDKLIRTLRIAGFDPETVELLTELYNQFILTKEKGEQYTHSAINIKKGGPKHVYFYEHKILPECHRNKIDITPYIEKCLELVKENK